MSTGGKWYLRRKKPWGVYETWMTDKKLDGVLAEGVLLLTRELYTADEE